MKQNLAKKLTPDSGRRKFLLAAGAAPAVALATLAATQPEAPAALPLSQEKGPVKEGYRETEHIRKYYYTAGYF